MKIYRFSDQWIIHHNEHWYSQQGDWNEMINRTGLYARLHDELKDQDPMDQTSLPDLNKALAPIGSQELWAAGVTYMRSKQARMEESEKGADFYDKVYDADRPELFFKALANRVVGTSEQLNIRRDSTWNVPEPELTLLISSQGTIEGYTIGNDMSSRSIEGENPLYLPQAKVYDRCAGLGPCIYVTDQTLPSSTKISISIHRNDQILFDDSISIDQMKRSFEELVAFLFRECSFDEGCFLMTGTGLVPADDFTLAPGDLVSISIEGIGTLVNTIGYK